jgi:ActR/RegA family two-component response regulator
MSGGAAVESHEHILIVEDEDEWCGIFQRAIGSPQSGQRVEIAKNFAHAKQLIEATKFAVAFVDVGLNINDDRNIAGLQVMEWVRSMGDETSIIVVTGRSGQDVLKIARDAIKAYQAYDTVGKSSVTPAEIKELLANGLEAYRAQSAAHRIKARDVLRGSATATLWDQEIMHAVQFRGGISQFYGFLNRLFGEFLPVVSRSAGDHVRVDPSTGLAYCDYWSRAIAAGVVICLGAAEHFKTTGSAGQAEGCLLGKYKMGDLIKEESFPRLEGAASGTKGAVFSLRESRREDFRGQQVGDASRDVDR